MVTMELRRNLGRSQRSAGFQKQQDSVSETIAL
jgi:hypothetical protein